MRKLFITDLDGTLLNSESRVSQRSAQIITQLSQQGAFISIATARTPATVEPLLRHTLTTPPAVVMTGAALWSRPNHEFIAPQLIPTTIAEKISAICTQHQLSPFIYNITSNGVIHTYFYGTPNKVEEKFIHERNNLELKRVFINSAQAHPIECLSEPILIFALGKTDVINSVAEELKATVNCSVSNYPDIFNHDFSYLEVFNQGVSKASAVLRLKEMVQADQLIVFGDNLNDIPMMGVADVAVAVDNALPQVKNVSNIVIGSNDTDSVAEFISKEFAKNI